MSPEFLCEAVSDFRVGLFLHLRLSCFLGAHLSSWSRQRLAHGEMLRFLQPSGGDSAPPPGWICGEKWECSPRQGLQSSGGCLRFVEGLVMSGDRRWQEVTLASKVDATSVSDMETLVTNTMQPSTDFTSANALGVEMFFYVEQLKTMHFFSDFEE